MRSLWTDPRLRAEGLALLKTFLFSLYLGFLELLTSRVSLLALGSDVFVLSYLNFKILSWRDDLIQVILSYPEAKKWEKSLDNLLEIVVVWIVILEKVYLPRTSECDLIWNEGLGNLIKTRVLKWDHLGLRWVLNPVTNVLGRKRPKENRNSTEEAFWNAGRNWSNAFPNHGNPGITRTSKKSIIFLCRLLRKHLPIDTLISDISLHICGGIYFCLFTPWSFW